MARTLEVIEGEDVLELCLIVHNRATPLLLALLQEVNEKGLDVLWLLVADYGGQVLYM
jgi:hypothetical protein